MLANPSSRPPARADDLLDPRLVARLARLDIRSDRVFFGKLQGERRSKKRGRSVEFDDHRSYVPGDDPRFIDWSVYARFDRLFIKLFLEEEDLALHVALDASASMRAGSPEKLLFAAKLAAALGAIGLSKQNRVGVSVFGAPGRGLARLPDMRGRRNIRRLAEFIRQEAWGSSDTTDHAGDDALSPPGEGPGSGAFDGDARRAPRAASRTTDFNDALAAIARTRTGTGVLVILSDFLIPGGYERGLRLLAGAGGYDVYALQILAPGEIEPEREVAGGLAGDLRLTDAETGAGAEVTISAALIRQYKERLERYCAGLHEFCAARDMNHLLVRSDADLEELLLGTLRRKGMLG